MQRMDYGMAVLCRSELFCAARPSVAAIVQSISQLHPPMRQMLPLLVVSALLVFCVHHPKKARSRQNGFWRW